MANNELIDIIISYNERLGNICPISSKTLVDVASLSQLIQTEEPISVKVNLIPAEDQKRLVNFDENNIDITNFENELDQWFRWIAFYPK